MPVKKNELSKYLQKLGRKGGKATAKTRTPEQRAEYARKGWAKRKKAKK